MTNPWIQRWREGRIGFHRTTPHPALEHYWPTLQVPPAGKVLVPLCGKSMDMRWLADVGHPVLGVEFAPEAIEQFMAERRQDVLRYRQTGFDIARQGSIELWQGDFFHLHIRQVVEVEAFYDRASLIALPPPTRQRYAFHLAQLVPPGARGLLISMTRRNESAGPPYSVSPDEVEELFSPNFRLTYLQQSPPDERGFIESVWGLERRGPAA
ncbi:hypothetical protein [Vreelandella jeotgali]|uniref:hypothetical protein n=1 Tax=Vreelandella jeotgali TaxID=553386 RepID=UPI00034ADF78|nr:hypothetical protein [Halomonas jeotgali]